MWIQTTTPPIGVDRMQLLYTLEPAHLFHVKIIGGSLLDEGGVLAEMLPSPLMLLPSPLMLMGW